MYRYLAAFLVLVSAPIALATGVEAKTAPVVKRPAMIKPVTKQTAKKTETSAKADTIKSVVREEPAVVVESSDFSAPEGALYTTSDECG